MRIRALIAIIPFVFCVVAVGATPYGIASHIDTTRVEGTVVSETVVTGWAPDCSELRIEPPKTIVDFSPDKPLDKVEIWTQRCSGAIPNPAYSEWEFRGTDAWRARRPIVISTILNQGSFECNVMFSLSGEASGPVDFTSEWKIVKKSGCNRVSTL